MTELNKPIIISTNAYLRSNLKNFSMFLVFALVMVVFGVLQGMQNPDSWFVNFAPRNWTNIFFQYSYVLILACGMVMCIIILGIDLSVGSVVAFVGALSAMMFNSGIGILPTVILSILIGAIVGGIQATFIAFAKIPAFIVTLAGMWIWRGALYVLTGYQPVKLANDGYSRLSTGTLDEVLGIGKVGPVYPIAIIVAVIAIAAFLAMSIGSRNRKIRNGFGIPSLGVEVIKDALICIVIGYLCISFSLYRGMPVVVLILGVTIAVLHIFLSRTTMGRYIYAVGGNARAADLSGISSRMVNFVVFTLMGALAGLAAVNVTGYMNTAFVEAGNGYEMDAIAACYIGGVSAMGGIGTVAGVCVGGMVMSAINNGMLLMNLGSHYQYVVNSLILLAAVFYDVYSRRKAGLG
jgi:putative multiple sugar transport system permease protein